MKKDTTIVVFRKFKDTGEIIALFPEVPATNRPEHLMSYMHVGQHGTAHHGVVPDSTHPVHDPADYADLKRELESIGYTLDIRKKFPSGSYATRREAIRAGREDR